jgi:CubicO group peptidase (beta-lactamase class C family)
MAAITVEVEPGEVGLDPARLETLDAHFRRFVDDGRLPGWLISVARHGRVAHLSTYGHRDVEAGLPVEADTVFRIYSMTKPITSVAAMMLWEEGAFELKDPVHRYIPSFRDTRVFSGGSAVSPRTEPTTWPVRVRDVFMHTAGLTYGFHHQTPVDAIYRARGYEWGAPRDTDLAAAVDAWAAMPLLFQPGTRFNYSVATDVLGRLVEVWSGRPLDVFLRDRILGPLGMDDTAFWVGEGGLGGDATARLAALYVPEPGTRKAFRYDAMGAAASRPQAFLSGGGGLVSTAGDYHRFMEMLRNRGELDGIRLLGPRTVDYMTSNHLPDGVDLEAFGQSTFAETAFDGVGFGLGFSVMLDPVRHGSPGSVGEYGWGGAATTAFLVDPVEDLTVSFFTQLLPSSTHPVRPQLKQMVHQALVD